MMPFDPPTTLDESEKQFLRDNKNSEFMRIVKKLIKSNYELTENGYLNHPEHKADDLLVLKGQKLALRGLYQLLAYNSGEAPQILQSQRKVIPPA